ncbi:MAG: hypothetical protein M5U28_47085 [Sandaracinaceae bacterium]|nr:hypothetical protein [Sandaracinaceae bacterium]
MGAPAFFVALTDEEREWNRVHGAEECSQAPCGTSWALWPSAPLFDAERGRAWVLYGLYNDAHPSGIGVASWDGPDEPVVRHRVGDSWLLFTNPQPELANAPTIFDGHLYAFGCQRDFLAHECMLGRAPLTSPDDPNAWQFFDGARWSPRIEDAVVLFEGLRSWKYHSTAFSTAGSLSILHRSRIAQ